MIANEPNHASFEQLRRNTAHIPSIQSVLIQAAVAE
jgi:hypothetical protein